MRRLNSTVLADDPSLRRKSVTTVAGDPKGTRRLSIGFCACVLALLLGTGCGDQTQAPMSPLASGYLSAILDHMQQTSVHRAQIDWTDFRAQVRNRAQGAQTILDLYPAISLGLGLLDDHHSFYADVSGTALVGNPRPKDCSAPPLEIPAIPPDIGYVHVSGFWSYVPGAAQTFADGLEAQIKAQDSPDLAGWIVDLRGNTGGLLVVMLAGIGSILGDGVAGYLVDPVSGSSTRWGYAGGQVFWGDYASMRTSAPYTLIRRNPKVAVLTDRGTVSSGEGTTVSFRARPKARSFGGATCGLSSLLDGFVLSDSAVLYVESGLQADRTGTTYGGGAITPDELVDGELEVVERAIAWLRQ